MKRVAEEGKPVVVVPPVVEPVEVGLALGVIPPTVRQVPVATQVVPRIIQATIR